MAKTTKPLAASSGAGWVRTEMEEVLAAPISDVGLIGWMRQNLFSSIPNTILTLIGAYLIYLLVPPLINFGVVHAVWNGENREACVGSHGACWAYVKAYFPQFIYGRYPDAERWRVNLVFLMLAGGLIPLLMPSLPFKRANTIFMLLIFPVVSFILLTGGNVDPGAWAWIALAVIGIIAFAMVLLPVIAGQADIASRSKQLMVVAVLLAIPAAIMLLFSIDFGLEHVETANWGGLLVTLVIAITGIAASLPFGIALALGRRSQLPIVRLISVIFIEFWRGVPLITVLFMSSVVLPLFMNEGVTIDKLFRVLVGVTLFASAYMAEVVRGGLQAIPKGQYEGADALGLTFWQKMNLIVLPQALKLVIPGIVNTFIGLFKDTTLVLIVGLFDLLGQIQSSFTDPTWSSPTQGHTGYLFAAIMFWIFCFSMSRYSIFMEKRLDTGRKR
ncbi:MAG: amino acid ABC transporter permease [Rhodobiaceae bacterium]|nr:amino acid ABC transporter permease [Rhodobiaceae bacterium]MCC0014318.1 amino acid ABC transporter permease [Rhodobiaceae bacterium]MCC0060703.1 amino acid ABC transporter permease [Rhodobiaceae bacterium]